MTTKSKPILSDPHSGIFLCYILLSAIGLLLILDISASRHSLIFFKKQLFWFCLSLPMVLVISKITLENVRKWIGLFLLGTIVLLVLVLLVGAEVKGARRSLNLHFFNIQPSLLARIILVLYFAHILDKKQKQLEDSQPSKFIKNFMVLFVITGLVFFLIYSGRHLSTLIIMSITLLSMLWLSGVSKRTFFLIIAVLTILGFSAIKLGAKYRGDRINTYSKYSLFHKLFNKNSEKDFDNEFQIKESLTAMASGKFTGTKPSGGRGKYYFLPEARTDYIFAIIGEEFGFLGSMFVFGIYIVLFFFAVTQSWQQKSLFLKLAGCGLALNLFLNVLINMGVSMSALPSTGVTLPFISYGGTSFLVNSFSLALLIGISKVRR